ncbi:MAG: 3-deoxy-7-phosphoheptulonate synthase [Planctomycetes bacterium]|nr:3-deoxy-7-phosphoheptulonate synthase [Planctomycetota bacterium]
MIVVMRHGASPDEVRAVTEALTGGGFRVHRSDGAEQTILGVIGDLRAFDPRAIEVMPGVQTTMRVSQPYKLASRSFHPEDTVIRVGGVDIGGRAIVIAAGPCAVESRAQIRETARIVRADGARILRGGAYKPRSSPYSFQGLGEEGLELLREAADENGLLVVTEALEIGELPAIARLSDIIQVGARNMQNFPLLRAIGRTERPVLLKRGIASTIEEWLLSAEYIMAEGNGRVILCERGIRTFEPSTRNTLDVSAIPMVEELSHLPVFADPSHASGLRSKVLPLARAAVAAGADGIIVEVHPQPDRALSDGPQSLRPEEFRRLVEELRGMAPAIGRTLA